MLFVLLMTFLAAAAGLAWYLLAHDRGEPEPVMALWMAAGCGILGALLAGGLEAFFVSDNLKPGTPVGLLFRTALGVGVIEEACKFLPLAFLLYRRRYFNEYTDGVIYFALAGLGFGLPENILYTLQFGAGTGIGRLILTPLFHAATTGLVGYFLIRSKLTKRSPWLVAMPLAAMMLLHAFYDFGLTSGKLGYQLLAIMTTLSLSAGLFVLYLRATEHDQDLGLSAVGHNNFCRACGQPNPEHHLYCTHCGQRA